MNTDQLTQDELEQFLIQAIKEDVLATEREIAPTTALEEAGLDSLRLTQLLLAIEEETGVWLDEEYLTPENLEHVRSLAECLRKVLADE